MISFNRPKNRLTKLWKIVSKI